HSFQHRSTPPLPRFRSLSDTVPDQFGHPSNPVGHHSNGARKLSDISPEHCPIGIGTLSDRNWNQCPTAPGIRIMDKIRNRLPLKKLVKPLKIFRGTVAI